MKHSAAQELQKQLILATEKLFVAGEYLILDDLELGTYGLVIVMLFLIKEVEKMPAKFE
jgi:hypothetical protein